MLNFLYSQIVFTDGWLGMCYHRPNGRIQGLFQAMAYQSGNIYRNDSISLFRCGLMLRYTCMYTIILDLCLNLLIWTPLVTNILALWVWEVFGMKLILNIKQLHINWEIFTGIIVLVSFFVALYILRNLWMSIFLIYFASIFREDSTYLPCWKHM